MNFRLPRPTYPIAGEFFLGALLVFWGADILVFPGQDFIRIHSWQWLWQSNQALPVAVIAVLLGLSIIVCAYRNLWIPGKVVSALSMALWLQFAVKTFEAVPGIHPPASGTYLCCALCQLMIVLSEDQD